MPSMTEQVFALLVLALPVASIAWTVTHEELLQEFRDFCTARSKSGGVVTRKFFYVFTCEYCFSQYVVLVTLAATGYRLLWPDWRGVVVAGFALVWLANLYMSLFGRLRLDIKHERGISPPTSRRSRSRRPGLVRHVRPARRAFAGPPESEKHARPNSNLRPRLRKRSPAGSGVERNLIVTRKPFDHDESSLCAHRRARARHGACARSVDEGAVRHVRAFSRFPRLQFQSTSCSQFCSFSQGTQSCVRRNRKRDRDLDRQNDRA